MSIRSRWWLVLVLALLSAACADGDTSADQSSSPASTAAPDATETDEPETGDPGDGTSSAGETDAPQESADPAPEPWNWDDDPEVGDEAWIDTDPMSYTDLRAASAVGEADELEVALTGFALLFGPIDGARDDIVDDGPRPAGTAVLATLERLRSELSTTQQARLDEALDGLFIEANLVFDTEPGGGSGVPELDQQAAQRVVQQGTPPSEEVSAIAQEARDFIVSKLGGTAPRFRLYVNNEAPDLGITSALGTPAAPTWCNIVVDLDEYPDIASNRSTIAHEVFHCWHWFNASATWNGPQWITEGLAEWVGEDFAGGTASGADSASGLTNASRYSLYGADYSAVAFFWEADHLLGPGVQMWDRANDLIRQNDSPSAFGIATAGLTDEQRATLASMPVLNASFGTPWTFDSPTDSLPGRQPLNRRGLWSGAVRATPGGQAVTRTGWSLGTGQPVWIETTTEGTVVQRWEGGEDELLVSPTDSRYCSDGECLCADGRQLHPDAEQVPNGRLDLLFAVAGRADSGSEAFWNLVDVAEACGDKEPAGLRTAGTGLVGTWRANPRAIASAFEFAFADSDLDIAGVGGDLYLTLEESGQATLQYDNVEVFVNDEALRSVTLSGSGVLRWGVARGQLRFTGASDFEITAIADTFLAGDVPGLTITDEDVGGFGSSTFGVQVSGPQLWLFGGDGSRGEIVFPDIWIRQ